MAQSLAQRTFTPADQDRFAELSGDHNPIHVDAMAARRTQAGAPVVHGIHCVLWTLETALAGGRLTRPIKSLKVRFQKFVYVGSPAFVQITRETESVARLEICSEGLTTVSIDVGLDDPVEGYGDTGTSAPQVRVGREPLDLRFADLANLTGSLAPLAHDDCERAFPHLCEAVGSARSAALVQLSTLVGMVCPGLHSIFSGFTVNLMREPDSPRSLRFEVSSSDERFCIAEISVVGGGIEGIVTAFLRQPPVAQPDIAELRACVDGREFMNSHALIIGGSRGLGALTARAIAAGGGRVIVTYAVGEAEAVALRTEIGPACSILRYDAREDARAQLALPPGVNQLYYFATSHIFRQKPPSFVAARFAEFCEIYITGFEAACRAALESCGGELTAFYPSSVAVEEHPREMTEYSMAKSAAEVLCADLNRFVPGLRVIVERLPRVLTDQTATVMPVQNKNALEIMLPIIRKVNEKRSVARTG